MKRIIRTANDENGLTDDQLYQALKESLDDRIGNLKRVLIIPPDMTRLYSGAGKITRMYYDILKTSCPVDIMPALGTHEAMTKAECLAFFGESIQYASILVHDWKKDVVQLGEVPGDFVKEASEGLFQDPIDVEVNKRIVDGTYDLILSVGQVVPHEVVGMANYSKNIFVGCGGSSMINSSHMLGAFYGIERIMGRDFSPVRKVFDYAEEHFLQKVPLLYILTVTTQREEDTILHGLYIGRERSLFEAAVKQSQEKNMTFIDQPLQKVVVYLDEREFKSTWLGNKAIYRTRMAVADGGELIILAPGVKKFGEDPDNDRLIRKYGYIGREKVLELCRDHVDLKQNLSVAAHIIHSAPDGRFSITYAVEQLTREEVEGVGFRYMQYRDAAEKYYRNELKEGLNTLPNGEEIYFIGNPALGLWSERKRF